MKDFLQKADEFQKAKDNIDDYIWEIFHKYCNDMDIYFAKPKRWKIKSKYIKFTGKNEGQGCYYKHSIIIPKEFFIDYDKAMKNE